MKARLLIIKLCLILMFLSSCNVTYKVLTTDNEMEELLYMPCGKLSIEMIGRGNSKFTIRQRFEITDKVLVFPENFKAYYNDNQVDIIYLDKKLRGYSEGYELIGDERFDLYFELNEGVFDGDTIAISAPRYINCTGDFVGIDTVYYTFVNRLRIYGVNAL